jgi:hypothetical protein
MGTTTSFISYSWDSVEHKKWVLTLATELQKNGIFIHLDQWDLKLGMDLPHYMETQVRDCDYTLLICTPNFALKANTGAGGVGYEKNIVTGEIFSGAPRDTKFVPVLRDGSPSEAIPSYLKSKFFVDMRETTRFDLALEELLRHMHGAPVVERPPLGAKPRFASSRAADKATSNTSRPTFDMARFKALRDYAYASGGLDLSPEGAARWAEERMEDSNFDLPKFKELRDYAYRSSGLDLSPEGAKRWAEARMKNANFDLLKFKELRGFAYRSDGLNLNPQAATRWALSKLGYTD